jgi:superfamily I DNA and/or RNA helicase
MFFATINRVRECNPDGYALLGDPKQLPVITTQPLLRPNIATFVMRRKPYTPHQLVTQHRMHEDICDAVNSLRTALGTYPINSGKEVRDRNLEALGYTWHRNAVPETIRDILDPEHPLVLVDSDKLGGVEEKTFRGSWRNVAEAKLAARLAQVMCESYSDAEGRLKDIAVLSPYAAQVVEIRQHLPTDLQKNCTTIYKAQGHEYDCVVLSFVRSNPQGFIGFLEESELKAQTYVACSRAEAKLIVILSFQTFFGKSHKDFDYLNETRSAFKFGGSL